MCATNSSLWARYPDGTKEKVADGVSIVRQDGESVLLGMLAGATIRLVGSIYEVDFSNSTVTLSLAEAPSIELSGTHEHDHEHAHQHAHHPHVHHEH